MLGHAGEGTADARPSALRNDQLPRAQLEMWTLARETNGGMTPLQPGNLVEESTGKRVLKLLTYVGRLLGARPGRVAADQVNAKWRDDRLADMRHFQAERRGRRLAGIRWPKLIFPSTACAGP